MIDIRRLTDRWWRSDVVVRDLPVGLLFLVVTFVPMLQHYGTEVGNFPARPLDGLAVVAALLECLPIALRRRMPMLCMALVATGFVIDQVRAYHLVAGSTLVIALFSTGAHLERYRRTTAAALTVVYAALVVVLVRLGSTEGAEDFTTFYLLTLFAWGAGSWLRSARTAETERRQRVAETTRTSERTRIARELHDVVTHHVTAMVVQTEAARYLTATPDRLDATLAGVTDTGRRAIADLRQLLDVLKPDHDTAGPTLAELRGLVERTRKAGQPVEFIEEGEPDAVAGSAGFTAYRVVQEALTNALKYAHGSRTVVRLRYREADITVDVDTDGTGAGPHSSGGGRGLTGLRERVEALAGEFSAEGTVEGGFGVRARIPAGEAP